MALELAFQEFRQKYMAVNSQKVHDYLNRDAGEEEKKEAAPATSASKFYKKASELPVIASECPGW
eukprot:CAMPEP_0185575648 /NCGR_PEP_ID=MMETSP0434-20130131/6783_1 /TAXON_ID=626734 ORGANISM="Favella taraikaensis, Strain Fe Narragansett Bay" /NCGR_SAMPLE_ID=MMETSP0434 /ASSEMBLY_ACC=CAM_ASM_000379 /LENGTH=64 /DNA_ID=CAMNT_0028192587 /DNA_START=322 /DNA_END=513 /DNA_ORIENTATION=+